MESINDVPVWEKKNFKDLEKKLSNAVLQFSSNDNYWLRGYANGVMVAKSVLLNALRMDFEEKEK